jgi:2Fe-2S ferredoxin
VDSPWFERLPVHGEAELELLDYVTTRRNNSRLGCQIVLSEELDGIVVHVPLPERATE